MPTGYWSNCSRTGPSRRVTPSPPSAVVPRRGGWRWTSTSPPTTRLRSTDATLIEAMVGFDRVASWAAARQARLLAELAARRPADKAPHIGAAGRVWAASTSPTRSGSPCIWPAGTAVPRVGTGVPAARGAARDARIVGGRAARHREGAGGRRRHLDAAPTTGPRRAGPGPAEGAGADPGPAQGGARPGGAGRGSRGCRGSGTGRRAGTGGWSVTPEADGMASLWALLTATEARRGVHLADPLARGLGLRRPARAWTPAARDILAALLDRPPRPPTPTPTRHRDAGRRRPGRDGGDRRAATRLRGRPIQSGDPRQAADPGRDRPTRP